MYFPYLVLDLSSLLWMGPMSMSKTTSLKSKGTWNLFCLKSVGLFSLVVWIESPCVLKVKSSISTPSYMHGQETPGGFCKSPSLGDAASSLLALAILSQPADNEPAETSMFAPMDANKPNQASKSAQFLSPSAVPVTSIPTQSSAPGDCSSSQRSLPSD